MHYLPTFDRRLTILLIGQAIAGCTVPVFFIVSGLLGPSIAPTLELSTLPVSLVVVGIALGSSLVGRVMATLGRKRGHLLGLFVTMLGVAAAAWALTLPDFYLYSVGAFVSGVGHAFNNQIRFTAADSAGPQKAVVHSWVLMFGLFAALLGPSVAEFGRQALPGGEYVGSLLILLFMLLALAVLFAFLPTPVVEPVRTTTTRNTRTRDVLCDRKFWQAALPGVTSFVTMTLLMTATPLEMHHHHHFSHGDTTNTVSSHIVAMYLPSLFGGLLIAWLGIRRLTLFSIAIFAACIAVGYFSSSLHGFWWALVLLGIGWNFLFLAGSTAISQSYSGPERFAAQGANDTIVYGTQAIASLASGWLIFAIGWKALVLVPVPLLLVLLFTSLRERPTEM